MNTEQQAKTVSQATRLGLSLIEVTLATAVLAVGMTVTLGVIGDATRMQDNTLATQIASITTANLNNLYASASFAEIANWQTNTNFSALAQTNVATAATTANLVSMGVLHPEVGHLSGSDRDAVNRLHVQTQYYRIVANRNAQGAIDMSQPGLWQQQNASASTTTAMKTATTSSTYSTRLTGTQQTTVIDKTVISDAVEPCDELRSEVQTISKLSDTQKAALRITNLTNTSQLTPGNPVGVLLRVVDVGADGVSSVKSEYLGALATPR